MAYMDQDKKQLIVANLKKVIPNDWKYSVSVNHHSTIVLTVKSCPIDLIGAWFTLACKRFPDRVPNAKPDHLQVNTYWISDNWPSEIAPTLQKIADALNTGNHDRSDSQSDYFDVGHYIDLNLGRWNQPFTVKA